MDKHSKTLRLGLIETGMLLEVSQSSIFRWARSGRLKSKSRHPFAFDLADVLAFRDYRAALPPERRGRPSNVSKLARKLEEVT